MYTQTKVKRTLDTLCYASIVVYFLTLTLDVQDAEACGGASSPAQCLRSD